MEKTVVKEGGMFGGLAPALVIVALAFALVVIAYGMESVAPGVHDALHDFRHVLGMPCH
ncbi:MAG: CbtB domain-containing protein [Thermodesulfobacteriota bacterium]